MKVAVVGVGRVGLPLAAVCSKFVDTTAIDIDLKAIQRIRNKDRFSEPQLQQYLQKYSLKATIDFSTIRECELVFVCVGSQSPGQGYSAKTLMRALEKVEPYLLSKLQVLIIVTTLPVSALKEEILPWLSSKKVMERILGVCYNPTMIALGNAVREFERPNYVMIGESNSNAGDKVFSFWRTIVGENITAFRSSLSNIALAKYILNTALVLKITLMNTITEMCEKAGGDVDLQAEILKADPRIAGPKMFKGGLGYGGTCYPVDVEALRAECERLGLPTLLPEAVQAINTRQVERTVELIKSLDKKEVAILGVTYKPDTSIVVASQPIEIAQRLVKEGHQVMLCDPRGIPDAKAQLGDTVLYTEDLTKALSFGKVVLLGVEWPEYRQLNAKSFRRDQIVVDPWRILKSKDLGCKYVPYGIGSDLLANI